MAASGKVAEGRFPSSVASAAVTCLLQSFSELLLLIFLAASVPPTAAIRLMVWPVLGEESAGCWSSGSDKAAFLVTASVKFCKLSLGCLLGSLLSKLRRDRPCLGEAALSVGEDPF